MNESVLSVKKVFFEDLQLDTFTLINKKQLLDIIVENHEYLIREEAERNDEYYQIIPYIVLKDADRFFATRRTKNQSESRLHNMYSIGIGGHINENDQFGRNIILYSLERELNEEINISHFSTPLFIGVINDHSVSVSNYHLGLVFLIECQSEFVSVKERDKMTGQWLTLGDARDYYDEMESWSKILLDMEEKTKLLKRVTSIESFFNHTRTTQMPEISLQKNSCITNQKITGLLSDEYGYIAVKSRYNETICIIIGKDKDDYIIFSNDIFMGYEILSANNLEYMLINSSSMGRMGPLIGATAPYEGKP